MQKLQQVKEDLGDCQRCELCGTRTNIVFGYGDPLAPWMFIGEGPGANEDEQGLPFVSKAGAFLTKLITESGWDRESVYIANVVKCRPPGNRDPLPSEIAACKPFLFRQIQAIGPVVITTLGKPAANLLLDSKRPLYKLRGSTIDFMGAKVVPTYHPSYIQRGNWDTLPAMQGDISLALSLLFDQGIIPPSWRG